MHGGTMKVDFFTRKHKSVRARLFETSDVVGRADWGLDDDVKEVVQRVTALDAELRSHGEAEDVYIMPLLRAGAPDLFARMERDHEADAARRLAVMRQLHDVAAATDGRVEAGLGFYRAFNRYVAEYLLHLDDEETIVMPMMDATSTEAQLVDALGLVLREVAAKEAPQGTAHILAHIPPTDRAEMLRMIRGRAPPAAFEALLGLVNAQLTEKEKARLARDLEG